MAYPTLNTPRVSVDMTDIFKGYNHNARIGDGEFFDEKNISSDNFPVLSPRRGRTQHTRSNINIDAIVAKDVLCYVNGKDFIVGTQAVPMDLDTDTPKNLVSMGSYVLIFPDKKYVNTRNLDDYGEIEIVNHLENNSVTVKPCSIDGVLISPATSEAEPSNPDHGMVWVNPNDNLWYQYDGDEGKWFLFQSMYVLLNGTGISDGLAEMDAVDITGADLDGLNGNYIVWHRESDGIVVEFAVNKTTTVGVGMRVARELPTMDYVVEAGNRIWGCYYGEKADGTFVNEIYASKLGDFKNWRYFAGVSTDSYAASVGSDGAFTGAVNYMGVPHFFKETCFHKVYGSYPANFQIADTSCRGVQSGCHRSLAIVNEVLYYKSRTGICAYDGSLPVEVSDALGHVMYNNAVGGALGHKYYVSMTDGQDIPHLFTYDTRYGMWHKEDNTRAKDFCNFDGKLYYSDEIKNPETEGVGPLRRIMCISSDGDSDERVSWMAETGPIGTDSPYRTFIQRLDIRMALEFGSYVSFFIQYDSCGEWEHAYTANYTDLASFSVPIRPRRCDHLRIRIVGEGTAKIFSICKHIGKGSNR